MFSIQLVSEQLCYPGRQGCIFSPEIDLSYHFDLGTSVSYWHTKLAVPLRLHGTNAGTGMFITEWNNKTQIYVWLMYVICDCTSMYMEDNIFGSCKDFANDKLYPGMMADVS